MPIPDGLTDRISAAASRLAVTPAAFCLGTLTVLLARKRELERFVLAVPVDTRIHADAYDALGFFGVPVPFPAEASAGEPVEEVLRRTDGRLQRVLTKGAMFSDVLPVLAQQGLYRANAPLVEVYFNYVRAAGGLTGLEVLPAGTGYSDLDLMVTMTPDAGRIRLDHNLDILDAATVAELGRRWCVCSRRRRRTRRGRFVRHRHRHRRRHRHRPAPSPSPPPSPSATCRCCARRRSTSRYGTAA